MYLFRSLEPRSTGKGTHDRPDPALGYWLFQTPEGEGDGLPGLSYRRITRRRRRHRRSWRFMDRNVPLSRVERTDSDIVCEIDAQLSTRRAQEPYFFRLFPQK